MIDRYSFICAIFQSQQYQQQQQIKLITQEMEKKLWTPEDDALIIQLVNKYGCGKWTHIAKILKESFSTKRTEKQIRERWHNHLNPEITKQAWTNEEQKRLFAAHKVHGNKWCQIAKNFPGRTDNCIKNHFYSTLRRTLRKLNKQLGDKESGEVVKSIRPKCLTKIFLIAQQPEQEIENKSLYESCRYMKELLTESLENIQYKKNLSSLLQRKENFKKILLHIKELNCRQDNSDSDDSPNNNNNKNNNGKSQGGNNSGSTAGITNSQVQFYLNYQELEILKYEEFCMENKIMMTMNPRQFLRIFQQQNVKTIEEEHYKINLLRFERNELKLHECDKKEFYRIIEEKIQQKRMIIDLILKNGGNEYSKFSMGGNNNGNIGHPETMVKEIRDLNTNKMQQQQIQQFQSIKGMKDNFMLRNERKEQQMIMKFEKEVNDEAEIKVKIE